MRDFIQLFRTLTLRQILGLQLAWASSIGFVFGFTTWLNERGLRIANRDNVAFSMFLKWDLGTGQVLAIIAILVAPMLLWLAVRERTPRKK
ncbi:MAG: hypothetical protein U0132_04795 [Gemmatimonadaceae bacterium]